MAIDDIKLTTNRYVEGGPRCEIPDHVLRVQTRSDRGELKYFFTVKEAFAQAAKDPEIYKVSFGLTSGERVRLVRREGGDFYYEDIMVAVEEELAKERGVGETT